MDYSPGLAIATACFEISVAVWALRGPGERSIIRTTGAILLLLATYQIIEVSICSNVSAAGFLPQLAFIAVTWLPPLGLVLIAKLYRPRSRMLYGNAYSMIAVALGIVVWIALDRGFVSISVCTAVFARYNTAIPRFMLYSGFYWLGLLGMILFSGYGVNVVCSFKSLWGRWPLLFPLCWRHISRLRQGVRCLLSCVILRCCLPSFSPV
jgi:hypothetical protein